MKDDKCRIDLHKDRNGTVLTGYLMSGFGSVFLVEIEQRYLGSYAKMSKNTTIWKRKFFFVPSSANSSAVAFPIPCPAPVTITTLLVKRPRGLEASIACLDKKGFEESVARVGGWGTCKPLKRKQRQSLKGSGVPSVRIETMQTILYVTSSFAFPH